MFQKVDGVWRPVSNPYLEVGGSWRSVVKAWYKIAGVWRQFFGPLSVALDTTTATVTGAAGLLTTNTVTATPTQGVPGYTYNWEFVSGDLGPQPTNAVLATTAWATISGPSVTMDSIWRCKTTDLAGNVAYSANVNVHLEFV